MKQVVCQEAKECGVPEGVCFHQIAHDERDKEVCGLYMCHRAGFRVKCVYTPEPAKPHGVAFKGTASQLFRYLGGLTDERFQAMMHAGITIDTTDLKADALRVQEDANGEGVAEMVYKAEVRAIIVLEQGTGKQAWDWARNRGKWEDLANRATARIVKLQRP